MKHLFFMFFTITLLTPNLASAGIFGEPKISKFTCEKYWEYQKDKSNKVDKIKFIYDHKKTWDFHIKKFKNKHPALAKFSPYTKENLEENPHFIMFIGLSCPQAAHLQNKKTILGDNLQKLFYKTAYAEKQRQTAIKDKCLVSNGVQAKLFDPSYESSLAICAPIDFENKKDRIVRDENDSPIAIKLCSRQNKDECLSIFPSKENFCLSHRGLCMRKENGECRWTHTDESQNCIAQ